MLHITLLLLLTMASTVRTDEVASTSPSNKFFCEYNVLLKLVKLEQRSTQQEEKIQSLTKELNGAKDKILALNATVTKKARAAQGTTYIRWGRLTCPGDAQLIYDGYAAGAHYTHKGTATNRLCLPNNPDFDKHTDGNQNAGRIYGAEYQTSTYPYWKYLHDHDVPCAVCRVQRSHVLMVPGKNVCQDDYVLEYKGYLMSAHYNHYASEFVCVDDQPESLKGGVSDTNGMLFYFVEASCGALKCPPYVNGWELTCAVCSYSPK